MEQQRGNSTGDQQGGRQLLITAAAAVAVVVGLALYVTLRDGESPPDGADDLAEEGRAGVERDLDRRIVPGDSKSPPDAADDLADEVRAAVERDLARRIVPRDTRMQRVVKRRIYAQARDFARKYVRRHPKDTTVRPVLAELLLRLGELDAAERVIDALGRLAPDSPHTAWLRGKLLQRRGRQGAMPLLRRAAQSEAATAEMWATYGLALARRGADDAAREYLTRAVDARRRRRRTLRATDADRAEALGAYDAVLLEALGEIARRGGRVEEEIARLGEAWKLAPHWLELALELGDAQCRGRFWDAAASTLDRVEQRFAGARGSHEVLLLRGRVAAGRENWTAAGQAYAEAFRRQSDSLAAALEAARCYYLAGRYARAMKYIDAAAERAPRRDEVRRWVRRIENARFGAPKQP